MRVLLRIWYLLLILFFTLLAFQFYQSKNLIIASHALCQLVEKHFYQNSASLQQWVKDCHLLADSVRYRTSKETQIRRLQSHLSTMGASHLELWSPSEMSQMWLGEDVDTGIRVLQMDNYWIVTDVLPNSPAAEYLQVGDEVIKINEKTVLFASDVEKFSGNITVWRNGAELSFSIEPQKVIYSHQPQILSLDPKKYKAENAAVLKLKSFTPVFFDEDKWRELMKSAEDFDHLIIDLRGNSGGDFVVMQKILSSFLCEPTDIGYLVQPRKRIEATASFSEDMDPEAQIEAIKNSAIIELQTYANYPCYLGEIHVLIDSDTASTAEIFAEAIKLRKGTRLLGQTTSGAVLLAIWYPTYFGKQHSLSIPVALYKNWKDQVIEGEGVSPNLELQYQVQAWRNGVDNWIVSALKD